MSSPTPFFRTIAMITFGNRITETAHQDFICPVKKTEGGGELGGDPLDPALGAFGLQRVVGPVDIIRIEGKPEYHTLLASRFDQFRFSRARTLVIGIGMHHMDTVGTAQEKDCG